MSLSWLMPLLLLFVLAGCGSHGGGSGAPAAGGSGASPSGATAGKRAAGSGSRGRPAARPRATVIPPGPGFLDVMASRRGLTLRARPHGSVIAKLKPHSEWGSPTVVWAVRRHGPWLGVVSTALANNQVGWLDVRRDHPRMWRLQLSLHADLSERTLELRSGTRVLRRMAVGIGSPSTPTPIGRFSVTDKLIPARGLSYYGCCILALSGHQPTLRPGWAGGDRIAIHGGSAIGGAASAGCLHAQPADLRRLMRVIRVGTPVEITA